MFSPDQLGFCPDVLSFLCDFVILVCFCYDQNLVTQKNEMFHPYSEFERNTNTLHN